MRHGDDTDPSAPISRIQSRPRHRPTAFGRGPRGPSRAGLVLLPELLITVLLVSLVTGLLAITSLMSQRSYATTGAINQVQGEARRAFDTMATELRQAGGSISAGVSGATSVSFQVPLGYNLSSPCVANAVCWGARDRFGIVRSGWKVRYRQVGTQLRREILNWPFSLLQSGWTVLANNISSAWFIYTWVDVNTRTVTIQLQTQVTSSGLPGGSVRASPTPLVMQVRLRN